MNWMLAAIFICGSSVFASCVDNEDNSSADVPGGQVTEPYVEPTDDQLEVKVTADMPTAVLAQFDESTVAAALIKRLPQTTTAIWPVSSLMADTSPFIVPRSLMCLPSACLWTTSSR